MADYDRLFVSVDQRGWVSARGGKRPSTYYGSWNGEARRVAGIWHVDCGDGRQFDILKPPFRSGPWRSLGLLTTPPPKGSELKPIPPGPRTPTLKPVKPAGTTLEELLAEDEDA